MHPFTRRARGTVALLGAAGALAGCDAWRPTDLRGAAAPARDGRAEAVRVTRRDGAPLAVWGPRVVGDSLVGRRGRRRASGRVAVALADVARLERRGFDPERSAGALLGGLAALSTLAGLCYAYCE